MKIASTLIALFAAAAISAPAVAQEQGANPKPPAMNNMHNKQFSRSEVKSIQQELNKLGYRAGPENGTLTPETESALQKFQKAKGLTPNGEPSRQTLVDLGLKKGQNQSSSQNEAIRHEKLDAKKSENQ